MHFEKLLKGTPLGGLFHPQMMCMCTFNYRTPSAPPGHKLNSITYPLELKGTWKSVESKIDFNWNPTYQIDLKEKSIESKLVPIEILTYPSDSKGKSIEPKLISIEILTYPIDLTGTSHDFLFWCCSLMGFQNRTAQRDPKLQGQHSNRWCRRLCTEWSILIGIQVIHAVHIICIVPIYFIYIYVYI